MSSVIPVVDVFAGPGGLGEGFSGLPESRFRIAVSAEMEPSAHRTLTLRAFFRNLDEEQRRSHYYPNLDPTGRTFRFDHLPCKGPVARALENARREALNLTLGEDDSNDRLESAVVERASASGSWVLIGGPPCQAYSIAGRVRNRGKAGYRPETDQRHFLYAEYLHLVESYGPAVFVMENVKGILSSQVNGGPIFQQIMEDLSTVAFRQKRSSRPLRYKLFALSGEESLLGDAPADFLIRSERHGVPQARHRVIIVGVREDFLRNANPGRLGERRAAPMAELMKGLPRLRSHLSRGSDRLDPDHWATVVADGYRYASDACRKAGETQVADVLAKAARVEKLRKLPVSASGFEQSEPWSDADLEEWIRDPELGQLLNHEARGHMESDLARYGFCAAWQQVHGHSPTSTMFPSELAPNHANWKTGHFADRFRVQNPHGPSTTVTSHIAKDGHHFIHWDPGQCRSLTVREAARAQTFPDNYAFLGNRTQQYVQVGNAVPPYLARQIAEIVAEIID